MSSLFRYLPQLLLTLVCLVLTNPNLWAAGIKDGEVCFREVINSEGEEECIAHTLPYTGHTLAEYQADLAASLSLKELQEVNIFLLNSYLRIANVFTREQPAYNGKLRKPPLTKTPIDGYSILGVNTSNLDQTTRLIAHTLLTLLNNRAAEVFPKISQKELNHIGHVLYSIAHGLYLKEEPNFRKLANQKDVKLQHLYSIYRDDVRMEKKYILHSPRFANQHRLLVALLLERLETIKGFSRHWNSLDQTDWIRAHVPEMKKNEGNILYLGAITGLQAKLFYLRGHNVKATGYIPHLKTYLKVENLEPTPAIKKYKGYSIYYSEFFSWNILHTIKDIFALPGKRTVVILDKGSSLNLREARDKISIEKHFYGKDPSIWVKVDESEGEQTALYIIRKITEEPLNMTLPPTKVIIPQRTAGS
ncbi:hypothetical protein [Parendozoicomonas sp. Alg238-R29]|uniref:hypothetical protein n=1 Tax=Parendozoicomonas sp. Alg238-R29 TaxID=2993446 RepID=UPI00248D6C6B|nr:hypothetical protein [Parendozoicomonas sp. Alg238-R29]